MKLTPEVTLRENLRQKQEPVFTWKYDRGILLCNFLVCVRYLSKKYRNVKNIFTLFFIQVHNFTNLLWLFAIGYLSKNMVL